MRAGILVVWAQIPATISVAIVATRKIAAPCDGEPAGLLAVRYAATITAAKLTRPTAA
jgi:hypothetical protein